VHDRIGGDARVVELFGVRYVDRFANVTAQEARARVNKEVVGGGHETT
jgi:hypothetical protein